MHPANRLSHERSPYLLQHAHNPVDWYAWGDEVFERARREDKPVFVSIGYSACHWCHVMERESFEDDATAKFLNEHFLSVKIDREERPDIDQIYQLSHQILTQRAGGWPLSVFLTPDKKPFFAGTYFPNARRHGMPSFVEVLTALRDAFQTKRADVDAQAAELTRVILSVGAPENKAAGTLDRQSLDEATAAILRRASPTYGGFNRAPKFPSTMTVDVLAIASAVLGNSPARTHFGLTLDRMARGGIYDHLGGGFARYSTDERWLIPHFEKMLYDNAQLTRLYMDGWRLGAMSEAGIDISPARCETVVRETIGYILREMTDENGVFYSAQDADSEGVEGKFFVWTPREVRAVVGDDNAELVCRYFDVTDEGNFEHGSSALWTPRPLDEIAKSLNRPLDDAERVIATARVKLFSEREKRVKPSRDDKCLVAWNALMIGALADAGATLGVREWIEAATKALWTWRDRAWKNNSLRHAMKSGEAYGAGFLDDYAGLACAALDVYEATFDREALSFARELLDATIDRFWDEKDGSFFYTARDAEVVIQRTKEAFDHAYPGGMGLAADALLRVASYSGVAKYRALAEQMLGLLADGARESPMGIATVVRAVDRAARGAIEIVVVGDPTHPDALALWKTARSVYIPHRAFVSVRGPDDHQFDGLIDRALIDGRVTSASQNATAYVCRGTVCDAPVSDPSALRATLHSALRA